MSRCLYLTVACILMAAGGAGGDCAGQPLRREADRSGMLVGTAVNPARLSETLYAETLAREFNMVEPENAMKWRAIRPARDTFDFGPGDQVVAYARARGMKVRGHTLLWSEYNPAWLINGRFTPRQLRSILRQHITRVMTHYAGKVFAWDVVNEAFDDRGRIESSIWFDSPGIGTKGAATAYIEEAFRWARAADPNALLFYNDYGAEVLNAKSDAIYAMVKEFKRRGVPIDGVGLQAHISSLDPARLSSLPANIARLTALGVQVHITELDVGVPIGTGGEPVDPADFVRQADIYRAVAQACFRQLGCTALQTWGFTDKYTWIPGHTKGEKGAPLLFDRNYSSKPAYRAVLEALTERAAQKARPLF